MTISRPATAPHAGRPRPRAHAWTTSFAAILALAAFGGFAHAQSDPAPLDGLGPGESQDRKRPRKSDTPPAPAAVKRPAPSEPAPTAPAPSAPSSPDTFVVGGFRLDGNSHVSLGELEVLLQDLVGQPTDIAGLHAAADRITKEYRSRGFDLARAYLPAQEIGEDNVVTIRIVEGFVGEVKVTGNESYSDAFIQRFLRAPLGDGALKSDALTRGVLTLNEEFKDLEVQAALEPGEAVGTVDIVAEVKDRFPLSATLFYNNYGTEFVSRHRFGVNVDWTHALIEGAVLSATGLIGDRPDRLLYGGGSYVVPVGDWGTKVGISGSFGDFQVGGDVRALNARGDQLSLAGFVTHPIIKRRALRLSADLGIQIKDARFFLLDEVSSRDRVRFVHAGVRADVRHWGGRTFAGVTVAQGLGRFLGGLGKDDPRASRRNADNQFTRFNVDFGRVQPLTDMFSVVLQVSGQWSSESLVSNEEWQVGGQSSVRGFAPGEQTGDHGYRTSFEVRCAPLEDRDLLQVLAFADHGGAYRQHTFAGQAKQDYLTGAGVGLRSRYEGPVVIDLGLDLGWPIRPHDNDYNEAPVTYASVSIRF